MLLTSGRGQNTFINDLKYNLNNAKIVYIITAYITIGGLADILQNIQNCQEVCIIVGDMSNKYCMELQMQLMGVAPPAKKYVNDLPILQNMVQNKKLKILFARDNKTKIIHAKGYLLELWNGGFVSYVGSANLTHPAFYDNREWMMKSTDVSTANSMYKEFLKEWSVLSNEYVNVQDLNNTQTQQDYQQFQQQQQQMNQQQGFNGLGAVNTQSQGQIDMNQFPIYQNNQYYPNNTQSQGYLLGTIDDQEIRIGNGQFMSFLKSLFS